MDTFLKLDSSLSQLISGVFPHSSIFQNIFAFFSLAGGSVFVWLIIMLVLLAIEEKKNKIFILYFLISFLAVTILVHYGIKWVVMRDRPYIQSNIAAPQCPTDYSFPSGHAALSFAAAVILSAFDKKRRVYYYITAVIISYSRVYLYCHYLSDVITGAMLGSAVSWAILKCHLTISHRRK